MTIHNSAKAHSQIGPLAFGRSLWVAEGTPYALRVVDVRDVWPWAKSDGTADTANRRIVYHHTAGAQILVPGRWAQITRLEVEAGQGEYGLPYNVVVLSMWPFTAYYLNDVDQAWPHTYGMNGATAIAAIGNFSQVDPDPAMRDRMWAVADALATMWGQYVPELQHRDVFPTECPGTLLSPMLRR